MARFETQGANLLVRFESEEVTLLRDLLAELEQLLTDPADDPISARLLPDAYETEEEQTAYEELVGDQLRNQKLDLVRQMRSSLTGDSIELERSSIDSWLVVLTDLRLAIGTRLDVTEDTMDEELDPEDPDAPALSVLHWLGWVQESLLSHLS